MSENINKVDAVKLDEIKETQEGIKEFRNETAVTDEIKELRNKTVAPEQPESDMPKMGVVTGCLSLNVRKEGRLGADVLTTIPCLTEITIDENNSTDSFYKIHTTSGKDGFCMKKYISIQS